MLWKIAGGAILILLLACGALGYALKQSYTQNGILQGNVAVAEAAVAEQRAELLRVEGLYKAELVRAESLTTEVSNVTVDRDEAVAKLNDYRAKIQRAANGRPSWVAKKATRATRVVLCTFNEATGGAACEE